MNNGQISYASFKVIIILLLLTSCTSTVRPFTREGNPPTVTPEPYPIWLVNWLKNPTCKPPCWENIIPGVTRREDARKILSQVPGVSSIQEYEVVPYGQTLVWRQGSIAFDADGAVEEIKLQTLFLEVPLKDLLDRYGQPRYVVFYGRETSGIVVDLAFPENGLVIGLYLHDLGGTPDNPRFNVTSLEEVTDISFYVPGLEFFYSTAWQQPIKKYDWKGYSIYPE